MSMSCSMVKIRKNEPMMCKETLAKKYEQFCEAYDPIILIVTKYIETSQLLIKIW